MQTLSFGLILVGAGMRTIIGIANRAPDADPPWCQQKWTLDRQPGRPDGKKKE